MNHELIFHVFTQNSNEERMNVLLKNAYFRHEFFAHTWTPLYALQYDMPWFFHVIHVKDLSALSTAIRYNRINILKILVQYGIDIHADEDMALRYSAYIGNFEIVKLLVEVYKLDVHARRESALCRSADGGHLEIVKYLVEQHGADIHVNDEEPLQWSASKGNMQLLQYLIEKGADVNAGMGKPILCAIHSCSLPIVQYLVEHGADIHIRPNEKIVRKCFEKKETLHIAKYLIEQGADIHAVDYGLIGWCLVHDYHDMLKFLLNCGINADIYHGIIIRNYVIKGNLDMIKYLVEHYNINIIQYERILLTLSVQAGHYHITDYLAEKGCKYQ